MEETIVAAAMALSRNKIKCYNTKRLCSKKCINSKECLRAPLPLNHPTFLMGELFGVTKAALDPAYPSSATETAVLSGKSRFLTVLPVPHYGHCNFTRDEILGAFGLMILKSRLQ